MKITNYPQETIVLVYLYLYELAVFLDDVNLWGAWNLIFPTLSLESVSDIEF